MAATATLDRGDTAHAEPASGVTVLVWAAVWLALAGSSVLALLGSGTVDLVAGWILTLWLFPILSMWCALSLIPRLDNHWTGRNAVLEPVRAVCAALRNVLWLIVEPVIILVRLAQIPWITIGREFTKAYRARCAAGGYNRRGRKVIGTKHFALANRKIVETLPRDARVVNLSPAIVTLAIGFGLIPLLFRVG